MISSYLPLLVCYILHGAAVVAVGTAVCASLTAKSSVTPYEGKSYVMMRFIKKTFLLLTCSKVRCKHAVEVAQRGQTALGNAVPLLCNWQLK
jgi:hypothetical protein